MDFNVAEQEESEREREGIHENAEKLIDATQSERKLPSLRREGKR